MNSDSVNVNYVKLCEFAQWQTTIVVPSTYGLHVSFGLCMIE